MAINRDLTDLPRPEQTEGLKPDAHPRFVHLLAERLATAPDKPVALGTPFRFSDAGKCARYLSMKAAGIPTSDPMDLAGFHVTNIGTLVHEAWQDAVLEAYPGAQFELKAGIEDLTSGSCDGLVEHDGKRTLLELKTTGGFSYKMAVGERGQAEGPKTTAIIQTALNARAHDADEAVICVLATEAISKGIAERKGFDEIVRFGAEWTFTRVELEAYAEEELKRLRVIAGLVAEGKLAPRHVPYEMDPGSRIVDVDKSQWVAWDDDGNVTNTGAVWNGNYCGYCSLQSACRAIGEPGVTAIPTSDEQEVA